MTDDETGSDADLVGLLRHYAEREQDNGLTLAADRLEQLSATIQRVREEIAHAQMNDHRLASRWGSGPRENVGAVRIDYLEAALPDREAGQ